MPARVHKLAAVTLKLTRVSFDPSKYPNISSIYISQLIIYTLEFAVGKILHFGSVWVVFGVTFSPNDPVGALEMTLEMTANQILDQLENGQKLETFTSVMSSILPLCFDACIKKPFGRKISGQELDCLENCSQRYSESMAITANVFVNRINKINNQI